MVIRMWDIMKKISFLNLIIYLSLNCFLNAACQNETIRWKGIIENENGIPVIINPDEPLYSKKPFEYSLEWSIGNSDFGSEYSFSQIGSITVNDEYIYISDWKEVYIKIYDHDGRYIRTIGNSGQGPGEFSRISGMQIINQKELVVFDGNSRRLTFFSLEGELIKTLSIKEIPAIKLNLNSKKYFIASTYKLNIENNTAITELKVYNREHEFIRTLANTEPAHIFSPFQFYFVWQISRDDKIVYGYNKNYEFQIYDSSFNLIKIIKKKYTKVEISNEDILVQMKNLPKTKDTQIPKYHSAFQRMILDDKSNIIIQTWEKSKSGNQYLYDFFDSNGKFLFKVPIKSRPLIWKNDKFYTIEEDEEGFQYVKKYKVKWITKIFNN